MKQIQVRKMKVLFQVLYRASENSKKHRLMGLTQKPKYDLIRFSCIQLVCYEAIKLMRLLNFESSPTMGGPVTEEIISPQKSKPPPSRNPSQKSIRTVPPTVMKQQSTERLKPSAIGPQANKCKDKVD